MAKWYTLGLGRPTVDDVLKDELYGIERQLIDAEAKLSHARTLMGHHEVNVRELGIRRNQVRAAIERRALPVIQDPTRNPDVWPAGSHRALVNEEGF